MRTTRRLSSYAVALVVLAGVVVAGPDRQPVAVAAAVFNVDATVDTSDANPGDGTCDDGAGNCTLRAAVDEANALLGADTINVPAGTYELGSALYPSEDLTVVGAGPAVTNLFANNSFSVIFWLENGPVTLDVSGVTFTNSAGGDCILVQDNGPASAAGSSIVVSDSVFDQCGDAGILTSTDNAPEDGGGPVYVTVTDTEFVGGPYGVLIDSNGGSFTADGITISGTRYEAVLLAFNNGDATAAISNSSFIGGLADGIETFVRAPYSFDVTITGTVIDGFDGFGAWGNATSWTIVDSSLINNGDAATDFTGTTRIERSTISGNGFGGFGGRGPGVGYYGDGVLEITDSVVSGNAGFGLAGWADPGATLTVANTTVTNNTWGIAAEGALLDVVNSTISGNLEWGVETYAVTNNFVNTIVYGNVIECLDGSGPYTSLGHNLVGDATCGFTEATDLVGVDPLLGPLQDNGGPTQTMALTAGSPAIDAGDNAPCPATDQRGVPRPADGDDDGSSVCDIGSFELPGTAGVPVVVIDWNLNQADPRLAAPTEMMDFQLITGSGLDAWAEVDVLSWYPGGDPAAGSFLGADLPATVTVPLAEVGATGVYTGQLSADGVSQFVSVTGKANNGTETGEHTTTDGLPLLVGGVVDLTTALPVPAWMLGDSRAVISEPFIAAGDVVGIPAAGSASSRPLPQSPYYGVTILDGANHTAYIDPAPIEVRGGLHTEVGVIGTPVVHIPFAVEIVDFNGSPVEGAHVSVVDDSSRDEVARATTGPDGIVTGVASGADITVNVDPQSLPFSMADRAISLSALDDTVQVDLGSILPTSIVSGTVYRLGTSDTVPGIPISITTVLADGRSFTTTTSSDDFGYYEASVFDGDVTVEAVNTFAGNDSVDLVLTADQVVDLNLDGPLPGELNVELFTRFAGESVPTPVPIEWRAAVHFALEVTSGSFNGIVRETPFAIPVVIGEPIRVCADGSEGGLSAECVEVFADASTFTANASLELTQAGRVTGSLRMGDGSTPEQWQVRTHTVAADGTRTFVGRQTGSGSLFNVGLIDPGEYEIDVIGSVGSTRHSTTLSLSVATGDVIALGPVNLAASDGPFASATGSSVDVGPGSVLPGERVTVRVAAQNGSGDPATDSHVGIQVPAGTSVVPGSVLLDGAPAAATMNGSWLEVAAGTIGPGQVAVMQAWLDIDAAISATDVSTQGRIRYEMGGPRTEVLGAAASAVVGVTIGAPRATADFEVPVSGRAPAGSTVRVTADGLVLASVVATEGDTWRTLVNLPETRLPRYWELQAEADTAAGLLRSPRRLISYDPSHVEMIEVALSQEGGGRVVFDPTRGVAQFPYVAQSNAPFTVEIEFSDPARVPSAVVFLGRLRAVATYDPFYDAHVAVLDPSGFDDLGKLRVYWQPEPDPLDLTPSPLPPPFSAEELRAQFGAPFDTFEDLVVVDGTTDSLVSMIFPDLEGIELTSEFTFTASLYTPTQADVDRSHASGVPIYGIDLQVLQDTDDVYELRFTGFIPDDPIPVGSGPSGSIPGQSLEVVARYEAPSGIAKTDRPQSAAGAAGKAVGLGGVLWDKATNDEWGDLERVADLTVHCTADAITMYDAQADAISDYIFFRSGVKVAMTAFGLVGGPVGILAAVAGFGADKVMQKEIEIRIRRLLRNITNDPRCQPPDPDPEREEEENADDAGEPTWIFDPSGYAYELFADNRLEGVTATVHFADTADGPWEIWDAEWYLQDNPQITDPQGRYGWDVPEGWWRVRFDKDGYETAYSDALEVLPPHFDVNVGLTSLSPPVIAAATGYDDNSFLEVAFENFVLSDWVNDFNVAVTDAGDNPVPVVITEIDERTTAGGDDVAKVFRFDVGGPLTLNDQYTVRFDQSLPSYAGIPAGEDLEAVIEIGTLDPFVDDDDSEFEDDIEWMYAEGITMGCNPPTNDMFCPEGTVTRGMAAAFFVRALGLVDDGGGDLFVDDDGSVFESDIDKLATAGITFGCNPPAGDRFCPDAFITRGQIAAFFHRAFG